MQSQIKKPIIGYGRVFFFCFHKSLVVCCCVVTQHEWSHYILFLPLGVGLFVSPCKDYIKLYHLLGNPKVNRHMCPSTLCFQWVGHKCRNRVSRYAVFCLWEASSSPLWEPILLLPLRFHSLRYALLCPTLGFPSPSSSAPALCCCHNDNLDQTLKPVFPDVTLL